MSGIPYYRRKQPPPHIHINDPKQRRQHVEAGLRAGAQGIRVHRRPRGTFKRRAKRPELNMGTMFWGNPIPHKKDPILQNDRGFRKKSTPNYASQVHRSCRHTPSATLKCTSCIDIPLLDSMGISVGPLSHEPRCVHAPSRRMIEAKIGLRCRTRRRGTRMPTSPQKSLWKPQNRCLQLGQ